MSEIETLAGVPTAAQWGVEADKEFELHRSAQRHTYPAWAEVPGAEALVEQVVVFLKTKCDNDSELRGAVLYGLVRGASASIALAELHAAKDSMSVFRELSEIAGDAVSVGTTEADIQYKEE